MNLGVKNFLLSDRSTRLEFALKKFQKTENDLTQYVTIIQNWLRDQKHLPEIPHQNVVINFLLMNKFSIQNTKEKLEMYYSIRTILPEFFDNKHPALPEMQECVNKIYFTPLPKVTKDGYRVIIFKVVDDNPDNFKIYHFFANTYNITEIRIHEDIATADIYIYDFANLKVGHFLKVTPIILKKVTFILEKVYSNRVKQIHIINTPKYASTTISIAKQVMKRKIASRIHVHKTSSNLSKFIPLDILPKEYNGSERSLSDLNELWKAKLVEYKERFDALEKMRINEEFKPMPLINDEVLGFHGNFRKLDFD